MALLQIEEMPGYLAARFTGAGAPGEASQQFELIAEQCRRAKSNKLLIDITGYAVKASLADRFYAGERFRIFARYGIQVAFVCTLDQVDPQRFGELAARNQGVNLRTFTDLPSAEEWLLKEPPDAPP